MKAKTKRNWIFNLLAIVGVVFAFSVGSTYATVALRLNIGSDVYSTATHLARQENVVINDSTSTPIAFGLGSRMSEVSIQYSYSYSFDIRVKYSLSWSNGQTTDNVIIRYVNRDSLILDNDYIYYKDSIPAGSGILKLIAGVDFIDPTDETYKSASLTINITEVSVYKEQASYSDSHALAKSDSVASKAWIWYKTRNTGKTKAFAIVYNQHSTYDNGVEYPGAKGAYSRALTGSKVTTATWLGGNRKYGGMGLYIITGSNDYTLKAKVTGAWINSNTTQGGTDSSAFVWINNIKFNYTSDWVNPVVDGDGKFETREFNYVIPKYSAVYIELLDGIEITCEGRTAQSIDAYNGYRIVTNLYLNGSTFLTKINGAPSAYTDGIAYVDGLENSDAGTTTSYNAVDNNLTVYNTTVFNSALYNYFDKGAQSFYGNAMLVNNSDKNLSISLAYKINIYYSNGKSAINEWSRNELTNQSSGFTIVNNKSSVVLTPYSSINLFEQFSISIEDKLTSSGNSDAWVEIAVIATGNTSSATTKNLQVEIGTNDTNYILTVKNNTTETLKGVSANVSAISRKATFTKFSDQSNPVEPNDWLSNYWEYYTAESLSSYINEYIAWSTAHYTLSYGNSAVGFTVATQNGFSQSSSVISNSTIVLLPGESVVMGTIARPSNTEYVFTTSASATTVDTSGRIGVLFQGTSNAYIYNDTTSTYYVRFTGTMQGTQSNISTINNINYYVGVVRPGQIVEIPMSNKGTGEVWVAIASTKYELPSTWTNPNTSSTADIGSDRTAVDTMYKNYFKS